MSFPPFSSIVNVLIFLGALALASQAFIGFSFFISSVGEKERRATVFAAVQFAGMTALLIIYLLLVGRGFFQTSPGMVLLIGIEDFCKFCKKCAA